jgi:hypothetical protein
LGEGFGWREEGETRITSFFSCATLLTSAADCLPPHCCIFNVINVLLSPCSNRHYLSCFLPL